MGWENLGAGKTFVGQSWMPNFSFTWTCVKYEFDWDMKSMIKGLKLEKRMYITKIRNKLLRYNGYGQGITKKVIRIRIMWWRYKTSIWSILLQCYRI